MNNIPVVHELLNNKSFDIEFNGHLTNHVKHAVIALAGLDAPAELIKKYHDNYATLTPYGYALEAPRRSRFTITDDNWQQHLGQRSSFASYCDFFDNKEKALGTDMLLAKYLPFLLRGWVGAFTHATIHLGWALKANNRCMIIEGLAYMAFTFVDCHAERKLDQQEQENLDEDPITCFLRIAKEWEDQSDYMPSWVEALVNDGNHTGIHPELVRSGLQYRIARMANQGHPLIYAETPWLEQRSSGVLWSDLYFLTTLIYMSAPGDFVTLHLITSLFAMEEIAKRLPPEQEKYVIRSFWIGMLCILFSRAFLPGRKIMEELSLLHQQQRDPCDDSVNIFWQNTIARSFLEEEEHNPKLVFVLHEAWKKNDRLSIYRLAASHFTTTPILPRSFDEAPLTEEEIMHARN